SVEVNGDKEGMISSLIKLSKDNLSNLTPHPWYSFYHYSHPTTTERARAILAFAGRDKG
ncbi:MAG: M48 family metalloprotease, partial [Deltaproteobacteria bacterium]|nr:M48 family metalloprotease [Deltaproteobacteria bacterium]